ncbi:sugar phosphate isomerase/epimerase family protein [Plebeiibacterium sediminum]|uniref:Sugar phosphate isomerase/epimerase n=1 Tax=Plebeiibacterium sediminum TaxID=2992112 RepID=A0AAE3M8H7_9BACT|nr:sugar phosphate isomerase/epimerase [Plebeiobacterium sediminum]MCW3788829.1 sugar phosphate isomerase/epimerase [Plebeiobacterium sediminum]
MIYSRRAFINIIAKASLLLCSPVVMSNNKKPMNKINPGIQLYTVRNEIKNDLWLTLKKIADVGFKEIELYMDDNTSLLFGYQPEEFFTRVNDLGLKVIGQHILSGQHGEQPYSLTKGFESLVEILSKYEVPYLTHVWLHPEERKSLNDYKHLAELQNKCGAYCKSANIQLTYHNHDFEFVKMEGEMPYDVMIKNSDPDLLKLEVDFYWMYAAGVDPLIYITQLGNRVEQWHFKDMKKDSTDFIELGLGRINYDEIMKYLKSSDVKHVLIDQDELTMPMEDSLRINLKELNRLLAIMD